MANPTSQLNFEATDQPTVVDLFSGAGGTGLGFFRAGYRIIGAVEIDNYAAQTYKNNLHVDVTQQDIRDLCPREFRLSVGIEPGDLDVLVGCPPCQGFSRLRNGNGEDDPRNDLVLRYLDYVREFMPKFVLFENVPGLTRTEYGQKFYTKLLAGLRQLQFNGTLGYELIEQEVDAADYGVAQHRKRVIVVGGREGKTPSFPMKTHCRPNRSDLTIGSFHRWRTVRDEIAEFPVLVAGENGEGSGRYPNHIAPKTGDKVLQFIRAVPHDGGSRADVPKDMWLDCHTKYPGGYKDVYGRAAWDYPSNTITSGCTNPSKGRFVHPEQDRAFTAREAAALQSFPNTYIFYGERIPEQIGNAVPPFLAEAIANTIKEQLNVAQVTG